MIYSNGSLNLSALADQDVALISQQMNDFGVQFRIPAPKIFEFPNISQLNDLEQHVPSQPSAWGRWWCCTTHRGGQVVCTKSLYENPVWVFFRAFACMRSGGGDGFNLHEGRCHDSDSCDCH